MYYKTIVIILFFLTSSLFAQTRTVFTASSNVEDSWLDAANAGTNYGGNASFTIGNFLGSNPKSAVIRVFNLDDAIPTNATIIACTLYINKIDNFGQTILYERLCKPWVEGGVSWTNWNNSGTLAWGSAGANTENVVNCTDCYNATDGGGDDRNSPEQSYATSGGVNTIQPIPIDTCIANAWASQSDSTNGIKLYVTNSSNITYTSSESGSLFPQWVFLWTAPGEATNDALGRHNPSNRHGNTAVLLRHGSATSNDTTYTISSSNYVLGTGGQLNNGEYFTVSRPRSPLHYVNGHFFYSDVATGGAGFSGMEYYATDTANLSSLPTWEDSVNHPSDQHIHYTERDDSLWVGMKTGNTVSMFVYTVNAGSITRDSLNTYHDAYGDHVYISKIVPVADSDTLISIHRGAGNSYDISYNITDDNGTTFEIDSTAIGWVSEIDSSDANNRLGGIEFNNSASAIFEMSFDSMLWFNYNRTTHAWDKDGDGAFTTNNGLSRFFHYNVLADTQQYMFMMNDELGATDDTLHIAQRDSSESAWAEVSWSLGGDCDFDGAGDDGNDMFASYIESIEKLVLFYTRCYDAGASGRLYYRTVGVDGTWTDEVLLDSNLTVSSDNGIVIGGLETVPTHLGNVAYVVYPIGNGGDTHNVEMMTLTFTED